jgi:DNA-3-methyladenine glycosylase I
MAAKKELTRCPWCLGNDIMMEYHDTEWGVPVHDDQKHFEFIVLDGFQAGLSWLTVLRKRENYRKAFLNYNLKKVAAMDDSDVEELMLNDGIIRNRLKIKATIGNAKAFMEVQKEFGSFDKYIWQFVGGKTIVNKPSIGNYLSKSPESDAMSKALIKRGFKFVGSTICYAYMQAAGMVNDHTVDCFRKKEVAMEAKN